MIDLHTHSSFSDGSDTPYQLAQNAARLGITTIALTDHDTSASHEEMSAACAEFGLDLIAGVEVSLKDHSFTRPSSTGEPAPINVHMLAYFIPTDESHSFQEQLRELRDDRERRNLALVDLLVSLGFTRLSLDYLVSMTDNADSVGRPHFARAMFELHPEIVGERNDDSWGRIFTEWLGNGGKAYIPKTEKSMEEFIGAGLPYGVVFSIAHPLVNYTTVGDETEIATVMPGVLASLRDRGVQGVEAYYGGCDERTRQQMIHLTKNAGMIPTGGSDYHGAYKTDVLLGRGRSGDLHVPNEVVTALYAARG